MGAWGEKAFQNDAAMDWLAELDAGGIAALRRTLSRVVHTDEDDHVDVDDGASAIAAAEIVAAAHGLGRDRLTTAASAWLDSHQGSLVAEDLSLANRAVDRVLTGGCELRQLWDENGPDTPWHADVRLLLERLARGAGTIASTALTADARKTPRRTEVGERDKQVLVTFLRARGLEPTAQQMARIQASRDGGEIRRWLSRAVDAPSVAAVLDE